MTNFKRLYLLIRYNIKLQFRQGFYYAWLFITFFYIAGFYFLPLNIKNTFLPLIMLSEPSTFAMIFTGAIVLLERDDKMLENLFITPLSIRVYIFSKMISIAIPATFCTVLISVFNSRLSLKLDLKNISRDFILLLLLPVPLFLAIILRLGFHPLINLLSKWVDLSIYSSLFLIFLIIMGPLLVGMMTGLMLVDEVMKMTGILFITPFISWFAPSPWKFFGGILPSFWAAESYFSIVGGGGLFPLYISTGIFINCFAIYLLIKRFNLRAN